MTQQKDLGFARLNVPNEPVECLGHIFENDAARREHFTNQLREKLKDPAFRSTEGFPIASDEDILRLSDPPYYTACPNPFLTEMVARYGTAYRPSDTYHRDPFAIDVSVGKTDALYKAHGYHTKVPHLAIVPSILHYTRPGEIVLDGFCGSGMTGVAALWCGAAPEAYRRELESEWKREGISAPEWGARQAVLNDLSPAATMIAAGYTLPFDMDTFTRRAQQILNSVEDELGWMYETVHADGSVRGRINFTVWSEVFSCPECAHEIVFVDEALDKETNHVRDEFPCPSCKAKVTKDNLERSFETLIDASSGQPWKRIRFRPVLVNYRVGDRDYEKVPDGFDEALLARIERMPMPAALPTVAFPIDEMAHGSRIAPKGFTHAHHFFLPRAAAALSALWSRAAAEPDSPTRRMLFWFIEQAVWGMSVMNRYSPSHFSQVNRALNGVYYIASQHSEVSPWYILDGKLSRLTKAFVGSKPSGTFASISTGSCAALPLASQSVDYVFTDPPFGENIFYADLNFLVEAWHRVRTDAAPEAIIDEPKKKGLHEYQELMRRCFAEYFRVLKPGRWMTVVFSNSSNGVWRAIQEAMGVAGFVVADVRTLDKQQGSYRQVTSSAVKQDLVISAYRPSDALEKKFVLGTTTEETAWAFVREHLGNVPRFVGRASESEVISERTPQMLHDRMVAYHVQHGVGVPMGGPHFFAGLAQRFAERDGMYFLPEQVADYDRRRASVGEVKQLSLFVVDEASAIQWLRRELTSKPRSAQELTPVFMRELQSWAKHEQTIELRDLLRDNFLEYDGMPPVPSQIHRYLSTNFKELRNLSKDDPNLVAKAKGRWYVPDPNKALDLEKLREKALLREFEDYKASKAKKLKLFRTESVRVGFKAAYDAKDYATIVSVGQKLPESVLQEDEKLLMYYDVAGMRVGE
ncbi:MAG TPA: DNA methyltransferase [Steroidobacteraceae bacterium]|nr:DNA methyltransferase [Steroidobacteraceae bacterium]